MELKDFPQSLEWLKMTNGKGTYSGSYSKNNKFSEAAFCYDVWSEKNEEDVRILKAACHLKPAGIMPKGEWNERFEESFEFSQEGLKKAEVFLNEKLNENRNYFEN